MFQRYNPTVSAIKSYPICTNTLPGDLMKKKLAEEVEYPGIYLPQMYHIQVVVLS